MNSSILLAVVVITLGASLAFPRQQLPQESSLPRDAVTAAPAAQPPPGRQSSPDVQNAESRYHVHPSDVLIVSFPLSPELNQTVSVQPDGYISLLNVGTVHVDGLTVPELRQDIAKAYAGILNHPIVDVDLKDFQRPFFVVEGQVAKPGQYDLRNQLTVSQAVAIAGGFTPDAKGQAFLLHRVGDVMEVKKENCAAFLSGKNEGIDLRIESGDIVVIPTAFITKFRRYVPYTLGLYWNAASSLL